MESEKFRHLVTSVVNIENYGMISIFLFIAVFIGFLIWAIRLRKSQLESMSALPLEDDNSHNPTSKDNSHEQ